MRPTPPAEAANNDAGAPAPTEPWVDADLLTCLVAADPGDDPLRAQELPDAAASGVFAAWDVARQHAFAQWTALTDRANLQPQLEKAVREAIDLIAEHGHFLAPAEQGDLMGRLSGRWERGIVRAIREILRREDLSETEKVMALRDFATDAGLQRPEEAKPLDPVPLDAVRLVCWMAVTPSAGPQGKV
jgi:hypothetical protein